MIHLAALKRRIMAILSALALTSLSVQTMAQAPDPWLGMRVYIRSGAKISFSDHLMAGDQRAPNHFASSKPMRRPRIFQVEKAEGSRLWLAAEGMKFSGWANEEDVIPFDQAVGYYSSGIKAKPTPSKYLERGLAWYDRKEYDKAIQDYCESIRLDPRDPNTYRDRGVAWSEKGDYDKAIADYTEAIRLNPRYQLAFENRGRAWAVKQQYEKALADYDEAIRQKPGDSWSFVLRGMVFCELKDYQKSFADFTEALRLEPDSSSALHNRGFVQCSQGEHVKALADYSEVIRIEPRSARARLVRGMEWDHLGEYKKAIADFDEALKIEPSSAVAYQARGSVRSNHEDYKAAAADFVEAIRFDPTLALSHEQFAWLLATCPDARLRDGRRAVELATRACTLSKWTDEDYLESLAAAYAESANFLAAVRWQEKAVPLFKEPKDKAAALDRLALYQAGKPYRQIPKSK